MDNREINRRIRQLLRTVLGLSENYVRPANQNAPTGSMDDPFATVLIVDYSPTGWDSKREADGTLPDDIIETQEGQRLIMASVQFFRANAMTLAQRLPAALQTSAAIGLMRELGLGLVHLSSARDLAAVVNTLYEERAQLDIQFHLVAQEAVTLPTYGTFPISIDVTPTNQAFEVNEP